MSKIQVIGDIRRKMLLGEGPEIPDIIDGYSLTSGESAVVEEYVGEMRDVMKERDNGRPQMKEHWPVINKAKKYVTGGGMLLGGTVGYLVGGDVESTVGGAFVVGMSARGLEWLFQPMAQLMGVPRISERIGSLAHLGKLSEEYRKKLLDQTDS